MATNTNLFGKEHEYVVSSVIPAATRQRYQSLTKERLLMPTNNHGTVDFSLGRFDSVLFAHRTCVQTGRWVDTARRYGR
jgi:hypothetical protein